ncbi:hypothetical protein ACLOJK_039272 [Asimina triloba]
MFARSEDLQYVRSVFERMIERNVVVWTLMITRLTQCGSAKDAVDLFIEMEVSGFIPDQFALSSAISACTELGIIQPGQQLHSHAILAGLISVASVGCSLVNMYVNCAVDGSVDASMRVFDQMLMHDVMSWTAIITGYVQSGGRDKEAIELFCSMKQEGVQPNQFTFASVLKACANLSDADLAASGMKRDCIYFTKLDDTSLYVYHLDRGTISVDLPCPNVPAPWHESFWVMPLIGDGSESKQANQGRMKEWMDTLDISRAEKKEIAEHVSWSDLPRDILQEIALHLFRVDFIRLTSDHHLLFPKAVGYSCIEATTLVFLFDPFTKEKIQLPDFEFGNFLSYVSSSSSPTSPGCIIFAVAYYYCKAMSFYIYHRGDISWTEQSIDNEDDPVKVCFSNPVFYILAHEGRLGVYHPEESTWTILTKRKPLRICCCEMDAECKIRGELLQNLYNANVRKVVIMGLAPLGCNPHYLWEYNSKGGLCVSEINDMVIAFNFAMREMVDELHRELPDAKITFCDVFEGAMDILQNCQHYGFETITDACCGLGQYGGLIMCISPEMACANASKHVWWDQFHPTGAVNAIIVDSVWSGLHANICYPMNLQDMVP